MKEITMFVLTLFTEHCCRHIILFCSLWNSSGVFLEKLSFSVKFNPFPQAGRLGNFHLYVFVNVNVKNAEPPGFIMLHFLSQLDSLFENITQTTTDSHPDWTFPSMASLHRTSPPREQSHSSMRHLLT